MEVPIVRPTLVDYDEIRGEFEEVWSSGLITTGKYTKRFEDGVSEKLGVRNVIAVSSCTSGLMIALKSLGIKGEVIVPTFTFAATAHAIMWNGATPVFCDSEPGTYCIDVDKVEELITEKTEAIMPVYIFGVPPNMDGLKGLAEKHGLKLIFDTAPALGSQYDGVYAGNFGDVEVFSMSPTKIITSVEGGLITTNDDMLAGTIRQMRDYGKGLGDMNMEYIGLSARMSEFHSVIGFKNFEHLDSLIGKRSDLKSRYKERLGGLEGVSFQEVPSSCRTSNNFMVIFIDNDKSKITRDDLQARLADCSIQTKKYFYPAVHMQDAYRDYRDAYEGKLSVAEKASREGLALPLYAHMEEAVVDVVCDKIVNFLK